MRAQALARAAEDFGECGAGGWSAAAAQATRPGEPLRLSFVRSGAGAVTIGLSSSVTTGEPASESTATRGVANDEPRGDMRRGDNRGAESPKGGFAPHRWRSDSIPTRPIFR